MSRTSSSSAPARSAGGHRGSPGGTARSASWLSNATSPVRERVAVPPGSFGRKAGRAKRSPSADGRSTSTTDSTIYWGPIPGSGELGYLLLAVTSRDEREG